MKLGQNAKNAILIGSLCSVSYFSVYIARNILGAVTPKMLENGYTEAYIGSVSSLFFVFYAVGQLINGAIGDKIHAKWMIAMGLLGAGVSNFLFPLFAFSKTVAMLFYAMAGFFLSMIYGPMTKVVAENTEPIYATRCSLGYTFASFFASPTAGILASFLAWQGVFSVGSLALVVMSAAVLIFFGLFEKRGIVRYGLYPKSTRGVGNVSALISRGIVRFSLISVITGVVRTSVVFWLPTYTTQRLGFSAEESAWIFTASTLVISLTTFIVIFVYERLGRNMNATILLMFSLSAVFFILCYLVTSPVVNIICLVLAIMASGGSATMLWSRYCPSLRDTGMVSSATGFLDFLSYMAAAAANLLFANAAGTIGWKNLILVWVGLMLFGVVISLPLKRIIRRKML